MYLFDQGPCLVVYAYSIIQHVRTLTIQDSHLHVMHVEAADVDDVADVDDAAVDVADVDVADVEDGAAGCVAVDARVGCTTCY